MKKAIVIILCIAMLMPIVALSSVSTVKAATSHGLLSITFDDAEDNQWNTAWPIMQDNGLVGTFYVVSTHVNASGVHYMNYEQLETLEDAGNEIGCHSMTHPHLNSVSTAQLQEEIVGAKQNLTSQGFTINNFAFPFGQGWDNSTVDDMVKANYHTGRLYVNNYPGSVGSYQTIPYTDASEHIAGYAAVNDPGASPLIMNLTLLELFVDDIYSRPNSWGVITFHNVFADPSTHDESISTADFTAFCEYVAAKGIGVVTVQQALNAGTTQMLTLSANYGTTTPSNGLQNIGSSVQIEAISPTNTSSIRYVFQNWTGTGAGSYTGTNTRPTVIMSSDINEIAYWKIQYYLTVTSSQGSQTPTSQWVDAGTTVSAYVSSPVDSGTAGIQYACTGWTGTGSVLASGVSTATSFTVNQASTLTWNWVTQYYLTISSAHGATAAQGWYNTGASAYPTVTSTTVAGTTGTQYVFNGWAGDASGSNPTANAVVMNAPKTAIVNWKTQYYLTIATAHGSGVGAGWFDAGSSTTASLASTTVAGDTGTQYVFTSWSSDASGSASPSDAIVMSAPKTATANWKTQYQVAFSVSPSAGGSTSPSGTTWLDSGSNSISFSASAGYSFSSWSVNTGSITIANTGSSSTTATINGPGTIFAMVSGSGQSTSPTSTPSPTTKPTVKPTATPTPTVKPNATATPTATPTPSPSPTPNDTGNSATLIYGSIIGIAIAGALIGFFLIRKWRKPLKPFPFLHS